MKEEFLHHVWKFQLFNSLNLTTSDGEPIQVLSVGFHNHNSGPDFFNSKLKIGNQIWVGNVEIHINGSDWFNHNHQNDEAYRNVILHVVYNNDKTVFYSTNKPIPTLEVKHLIKDGLLENYQALVTNTTSIPCENSIENVDNVIVQHWFERLALERLERKSKDLGELFESSNNDWTTTFYVQLAKNFGFSTNALPFELLAKSLPLLTLQKHKDNLFQLEALLFGQAGFLEEEPQSTYENELKQEYSFLKSKYKLEALEKSIWKFGKMRPPNFPTIRIAQFAKLIFQSKGLFSQLLEINSVAEIHKLFDVSVSEFWETHYTFNTESKKRNKQLGKSAVDVLIINTVVPTLFLYGKERGNQQIIDKAIHFLEAIKIESNSVVNTFKKLNISGSSALSSQAMLELKANYCNKKKCLNCNIGTKILAQNL